MWLIGFDGDLDGIQFNIFGRQAAIAAHHAVPARFLQLE
jgi:hypothetical protein